MIPHAAKHSEPPLLLAVDSGATSARFLLFRPRLDRLASGLTAGFNFTEKGASAAADFLDALGLESGPAASKELSAVGIAMAGAGRADIRPRVLAALEPAFRRLFPRAALHLFHDGQSALWAALGKGSGVVITAGTGSIAYGVGPGGNEARVGGWGRMLSDEGGAWWIAMRGLGAILAAHDGRGPSTALTASVLERLDLGGPEELVAWLHDPVRSKEEVADLARLVTRAADAGDPAGRAILDEAGCRLAELGLTALRRLAESESGSAGLELGLAGSVLSSVGRVRAACERELLAARPGLRIIAGGRAPEEGAALLLADRLERRAPADLEPQRAADKP